jgi:hypothetical protein
MESFITVSYLTAMVNAFNLLRITNPNSKVDDKHT